MTGHGGVKNYVSFTFPSHPQNVAFARTAVAMFASQLDFTIDELDEVKVAVSEAVSNAVVHAYPDTVGTVRVEMAVEKDGSFSLRVIDTGVGIEDVEAARQAQWTTKPDERMGLGFTFMQEYMDSLDVKSAVDEGTSVIMRKSPTRAVIAR